MIFKLSSVTLCCHTMKALLSFRTATTVPVGTMTFKSTSRSFSSVDAPPSSTKHMKTDNCHFVDDSKYIHSTQLIIGVLVCSLLIM